MRYSFSSFINRVPTMLTSDFDYILPESLIAQMPPETRGASRMLVLHRQSGRIEHRNISDLADYLDPGDVMVFNDTRVFSARAFGTWSDTSGKVEVLLVEPSPRHPGAWSALCRSSRPLRVGRVMVLADGQIQAEIIARTSGGGVELRLTHAGDLYEILETHGVPPVPPYIHREAQDARVAVDRTRYQTVYARETGAVAAPTAGLHFSEALLARLDAAGVDRRFVTLHVGPGTFRPVQVDHVADHVMDEERYVLPPETVEAVMRARRSGRRIVAVGSTSVRTLETCAGPDGTVVAGRGRSGIFIHPPYAFKAVDVMLTNFHLPCSTLLMMVCALAGKAAVFKAYEAAVAERYRFYSYGDCMLIC